MPRDLEDEIFGGGESDLSDFDQDEKPPVEPEIAAENRHDEEDNDGRPSDLQTLPRFRKDPSHKPSDPSSSQKRKAHKTKRPETGDQTAEPTPAEPESLVVDLEEQRRLELYERIDEAAGKNKKGRRRRRKGDDEDLEMMADEEVARLRTRMLNAVTADHEANEERRPATAKLMLLPLVTSTMQKSHLETAILDNGVLEAVKKWLEPLPDRSLPALNIQRSLLQLLTKMSIDTQSLKASELGKIVLFYTKCPRVDPSIKRLAGNLVTSWLRPIIRRSASYRSRAPLPVASAPLRPPAAPSSSRPQPQSTRNSQRARIPDTVHQAFQFAPQSQLDSNQDGVGGSQTPAIRNSTQKATAKKTREWARKLQEAKKGQRMG